MDTDEANGHNLEGRAGCLWLKGSDGPGPKLIARAVPASQLVSYAQGCSTNISLQIFTVYIWFYAHDVP
jgi:hypothetical protein